MSIFQDIQPLQKTRFDFNPLPSAQRQQVNSALALGAAFRTENAVISYLSQARSSGLTPPDPTFNPMREVTGTEFEKYAGAFTKARNLEDVEIIKSNIRQELRDRRILAESGAGNAFLSSMLAATLDPINFIPVGGSVAKGVKLGHGFAGGFTRTAKAGALGAALQEIPLQLTQELRTAEESIFAVGASSLVSGILGGAVTGLSKTERSRLSKTFERDFVQPFQEEPEPVTLKEEITETPVKEPDVEPETITQTKESTVQPEIDPVTAKQEDIQPEPHPQAKPLEPDLKKAAGLRESADKLQKQIDRKRNPATAQQNPTPRRARIIEGMAAEADRLETMQSKLRGMAALEEQGNLHPVLSGITSKAQLETILTHRNYPEPRLHQTTVNELLEVTKRLSKTKEDRAAVSHAKSRLSNHQIVFRADEITALENLAKKAKSKGNTNLNKSVQDGISDFKRMQSAGIDTPAKFAEAKAELGKIGEKPKPPTKADQIKQRERELIGTKIPGFFPTPEPIVSRMLREADIKSGQSVLEPSAGKGNIADAIKTKQNKADVSVIEPNSTLRNILELKEHTLIADDFLQHKGDYDRIVMNPPFEKSQDIDHVRHAFDQLKPGGRLVAIMSEGTFFRNDKKAKAFQEFLDEHNGRSEKLPRDTFKDSERPTGVSTRLVIIDKPLQETASQPVKQAQSELSPADRVIQSEQLDEVSAKFMKEGFKRNIINEDTADEFMRVARAIRDLSDSQDIRPEHIVEALQYSAKGDSPVLGLRRVAQLEEGEPLADRVNDILEEMDEFPERPVKTAEGKETPTDLPEEFTNLNKDEQTVFRFLDDKPKHIDEIQKELGLSISRASSALGLLEFKDLVERHGGMRFARSPRISGALKDIKPDEPVSKDIKQAIKNVPSKAVRDELDKIEFPEGAPDGFSIQPFSSLNQKTAFAVSNLTENRAEKGRYITDGIIMIDSDKLLPTGRKNPSKIIAGLLKRKVTNKEITSQEKAQAVFTQAINAKSTSTLSPSTVLKTFQEAAGKKNPVEQFLFLTNEQEKKVFIVDLQKFLFMKSITNFNQVRAAGDKKPIILLRDGDPVGLIMPMRNEKSPSVPKGILKRQTTALSSLIPLFLLPLVEDQNNAEDQNS